MKRALLLMVMLLSASLLFTGFCMAEEGEGEDAFVLVGVVQGFDDSALTIEDGKQDSYTFDFTDAYTRADVPEEIEAGSPAVAIFYGGFEGVNEYSGVLLDLYQPQELTGTVAGIDGEAITVQDQEGMIYTFFFDPTFPRDALDEAIGYDSAVRVFYDGGFDEYDQFSGTFAIYGEESET